MALHGRSGWALWSVAVCLGALAASCGKGELGPAAGQAGSGSRTGGHEGGAGGAGGTTATGQGGEDDPLVIGTGGACQGLQCQQVVCPEVPTTITGVVYAPEGKTPLYNAVVYVPNAEPEPLPEGASCDSCGAVLSGDPIVTAITDTAGRFVLEDVPAGTDIPLVIQVGKWRRRVKVPAVTPCHINQLDDPELTRLPRSTQEGDLPRIALTTGGADPLECLLRKIGIDDQEFSTKGGGGRVHLYHGIGGSSEFIGGIGGGAKLAKAKSFWIDKANLMKYDVVLLACEGGQNADEKPAEALQAMFEYTAAGGRVFASHWNNYFLQKGPAPFPQTATFNHQPDLPNPITAKVDTTFPKGLALSEWLFNVGASAVPGEIQIKEAQHTVDAVNPSIAQQWIYHPGFGSVQYYTFNTPADAPAEEQCGRVVFSDIHVSSGDEVGMKFPSGCKTTDLSAQERALLFMLFDLSSCILPDEERPIEPPH